MLVAYVVVVFLGLRDSRETWTPKTHNDKLRDANESTPYRYEQSLIENHFISNLEMLGLNIAQRTPTCPLIFNTSSPIHDHLQRYFSELDRYNDIMNNFKPITTDLRTYIEPGGENIEQVCNVTKIHPHGLGGIFTNGHVSISNRVGSMEPLLPVFRSHKICTNTKKYKLSMDYLVHDFYSMCKNLKRHSRLVFVDMGASLQFHAGKESPAVYIHRVFRRFGFQFDHVYAYEITPISADKVYDRIPEELMDSFHWINVGVDSEPGAKLNPFTTILNKFDSDDFIVVKLDIDTTLIENRLAMQLRDDPRLLDLVDLFYYEDHRLQAELMPYWMGGARGSIGESLELMTDLRKTGVAAHYWT